jgi:hypothetical protein
LHSGICSARTTKSGDCSAGVWHAAGPTKAPTTAKKATHSRAIHRIQHQPFKSPCRAECGTCPCSPLANCNFWRWQAQRLLAGSITTVAASSAALGEARGSTWLSPLLRPSSARWRLLQSGITSGRCLGRSAAAAATVQQPNTRRSSLLVEGPWVQKSVKHVGQQPGNVVVIAIARQRPAKGY